MHREREVETMFQEQARLGRILIIAMVLLPGFTAVAQTPGTSPGNNVAANWKQVEAAMGRSGQMQSADVIKFGIPRKDLHVVIEGLEIKPTLALGSWAAFKWDENVSLVMGDQVLIEDEVQPVLRLLQDGSIQVSAVHNHLIGETPHVMYVHMDGHGDAVQMAKAIHDALGTTKTPPPDAAPAAAAAEFGIDQKQIEQILGHNGKVAGGVLQVPVPRAESITDSGIAVPPSMGVATALNFQPTGNNKAAVTGDFVLLASEVNPVMRALRTNGIAVTAFDSHMLMEQPRLYFMHFWANDDALKLARGLRSALDATNSEK